MSVPKLQLVAKVGDEDSTSPDSARKDHELSSSDSSSRSDNSGSDSDSGDENSSSNDDDSSDGSSSSSSSDSQKATKTMAAPRLSSSIPALSLSLSLPPRAAVSDESSSSPSSSSSASASPLSSPSGDSAPASPVEATIAFLCHGWTSPSASTLDIASSCPFPVTSGQLQLRPLPANSDFTHACSFVNQDISLETIARTTRLQAETQRQLEQSSLALVELSENSRTIESQLQHARQTIEELQQRLRDIELHRAEEHEEEKEKVTPRPSTSATAVIQTPRTSVPTNQTWLWVFLVGLAAAVGFFFGNASSPS